MKGGERTVKGSDLQVAASRRRGRWLPTVLDQSSFGRGDPRVSGRGVGGEASPHPEPEYAETRLHTAMEGSVAEENRHCL